MHFGYGIGPSVDWMREELTEVGVKELLTPEEVDAAMEEAKTGTTLLVINSVCGCAAGNARPALRTALEGAVKPDRLFTVFAGQEKEATARAREYFSEFPPSSPSFAFFVDGEIKAMIPRQRIEGRSTQQVCDDITMVFDAFCKKEEA